MRANPTFPTRRLFPLILCLLAAAVLPARGQTLPVVAIDLDPATPGTLQSSLVLPGPVPSLNVGVYVDARGSFGIAEVRRIVFGIINGFNAGGAVVTGITPVAAFDMIPGAPGASFTPLGGEFQFGAGLLEPAGTGLFLGGPFQYARFTIHFGALPPASVVRVFIGDRKPGSGSVFGGVPPSDVSGDATPDGTPVFGTAAYDEGVGAKIDYRDARIVFGAPAPCSQAIGPECLGECPAGETCTASALTNECFCIPEPVPCSAAEYPSCDGQCPDGEFCIDDPTGVCRCNPVPPCGQDSAPECDGACPSGEACIPDPALGCRCEPSEPPCEFSAPACGGDCPGDLLCKPNAAAGCSCQDPPPCSTAVAPECNGGCPPGEACREIPGAVGCFCEPVDPPCADTGPPACGGRCTLDTQLCVPDPLAPTQACICADMPCDLSPFPECGGGCPPGELCRPETVTGACVCQPDDIPCSAAVAPECGGICPNVGEVCEVDPTGGFCRCLPAPVPCSAAIAPECNGECPADEVCLPTATGGVCACQPPPLDCDQGPFPECGGGCPDGETCTPIFALDRCVCEPLPPSCQDSLAPECGGACPTGSFCDQVTGADACDCFPCDTIVPGEVMSVMWTDPVTFVWRPVICADFYNVYRATYDRLPDPGMDGLADDYGACFINATPIPQAIDTSLPPLFRTHFYLVTAENAFGEGIMGFNSAGVLRPNLTPCP